MTDREVAWQDRIIGWVAVVAAIMLPLAFVSAGAVALWLIFSAPLP